MVCWPDGTQAFRGFGPAYAELASDMGARHRRAYAARIVLRHDGSLVDSLRVSVGKPDQDTGRRPVDQRFTARSGVGYLAHDGASRDAGLHGKLFNRSAKPVACIHDCIACLGCDDVGCDVDFGEGASPGQ